MFLLVGVLVCISTGASVMGTYLLKPVINRFIMPGDMKGLVSAVAAMASCISAARLRPWPTTSS